MRILLVNKFLYPKGGDCIHAFGLEKLLKSYGHEVGFFAMQHPLNQFSDHSKYFPSEVDYSKKSFKNIVEQFLRPLHSPEVRKKFLALLDDFKPDIVHVHNIHSQLSPIVVQQAFNKGIPVVWSIHDYKLLCPRYDCRRDDKPCELCFTDKANVIRYRCMKNSLSASILAYLEAIIWNRKKLSTFTYQFICPSEFINQKMISGGFETTKLTTINNFFNTDNFLKDQPEKESYYCYIGRLSKEKGVETLLKSAKELPQYNLKIVGTGPLFQYFIKEYNYPNIEYCGFKTAAEVQELLSKAMFSVMPSECYENNPLAVIESLCKGTPVLGARTGGIPELITENVNGFLFESGNKIDLVDKIKFFWENGIHNINSNEISLAALTRFAEDAYYKKLMNIYISAQTDNDN